MKTQAIPKSRKSRRNRQNRQNIHNRKLKDELGKKLLGYSVTAGAVLTLGATTASAAPIKFTPVNPIDITSAMDFNIDGDAYPDLHFEIVSANTYNNYEFAYVKAVYDTTDRINAEFAGAFTYNAIIYPYFSAINLNTNASINSLLFNPIVTNTAYAIGNTGGAPWGSLAWNNTSVINFGGNFLNQKGFLGVEFGIFDVDTILQTHYGWVELEATVSKITIYAWGWETDPDTQILAGAGQEVIPEPATLLTLAMGASGLYAWRRGRKRKDVKDETQKEYQNS